MAQSVKLSDHEMAQVRRHARLNSRSVAGQITHWMKIGRAIEQSPSFDYRRVSAALESALSPDELSAEEQEVWFAEFADRMAEPGQAERAFFARRRQLGLGVGMTDSGELVRERQPAGR
jgi:ParD-like antitoxin of type II bacterial toxin-antitoxin system